MLKIKDYPEQNETVWMIEESDKHITVPCDIEPQSIRYFASAKGKKRIKKEMPDGSLKTLDERNRWTFTHQKWFRPMGFGNKSLGISYALKDDGTEGVGVVGGNGVYSSTEFITVMEYGDYILRKGFEKKEVDDMKTIDCDIEIPISVKIITKLLTSSTYTITQKEFIKYEYSPSTIYDAFEAFVKKGLLTKTNKKSGHSWIYTGAVPRDTLVDMLEA